MFFADKNLWTAMRPLLISAFLLAAATWAAAQTIPLTQNQLTNRDIVTLAKAGFNEDFILDFIGMSRTRFDTSVSGLADLAKEGLSERLIRAMLTPPTPASAASPAAPTAAVIATAPEEVGRVRVPKQSESQIAISNQAPYYHSSSFFWGLWKKKMGVGPGLRSESAAAAQLNAVYGQTRFVSPAGTSVRYVVVP
jgi:hypothetical protein